MSDDPLETRLCGLDLLMWPLLNKGTAFTEEERDAFQLHGLLPPHVGTMDEQVQRRLRALRSLRTDLDRYSFMRDLQDINETLYYALIVRHPEELLPIVYTPTVGDGCQHFSEIWRHPRGLFLGYPNAKRIGEILANPRYDKVRVIVVSDGERILGLGDQGAGGMGIPIGKLALYTACAGLHPDWTLPVLLDVGTDNEARLADPLYVGWRHRRVRGAEYDAFVETFVREVSRRWPGVLLQWEDFAADNARRLLDHYRDQLTTFNDDIQGTAAVALASVMAAAAVTGVPLRDQRIAVLGAGSAGCGIMGLIMRAMIDDGLDPLEARRRFFAVDRGGLLVEGTPGLRPEQGPFVQPRAAVAGWSLARPDTIGLEDVARNARPTVLVGVCGQPGAFSEGAVRAMAAGVERPAIFPLSNPTSRAEAIAGDLITWTGGRALIGTGSPSAPVRWEGRSIAVTQINNAYIFPGVGLGIIAVNARRVSQAMFTAAARALPALSPARRDRGAALLPPVGELRTVAMAVATAVARQAQAEGMADLCDEQALAQRIRAVMWEPRYRPYRRIT
jgi:malate dehydrogenase (oxaloacetate-decarboxylating)